MKVDHALRDFYDDRREIRHLYETFWALLLIGFLFLALDAIIYGVVAYLFSVVFVSVVYAKSKNGFHRQFWDRMVGLDGLPTEHKRELLAEYFVTDETDLEDLEP
jgi:hypothetical protein